MKTYPRIRQELARYVSYEGLLDALKVEEDNDVLSILVYRMEELDESQCKNCQGVIDSRAKDMKIYPVIRQKLARYVSHEGLIDALAVEGDNDVLDVLLPRIEELDKNLLAKSQEIIDSMVKNTQVKYGTYWKTRLALAYYVSHEGLIGALAVEGHDCVLDVLLPRIKELDEDLLAKSQEIIDSMVKNTEGTHLKTRLALAPYVSHEGLIGALAVERHDDVLGVLLPRIKELDTTVSEEYSSLSLLKTLLKIPEDREGLQKKLLEVLEKNEENTVRPGCKGSDAKDRSTLDSPGA